MGGEVFRSVRKHYNRQNEFSPREVGLKHPDNSSFIKVRDDGSIEIFAGDEVSIVLNAVSRTITFNADVVKFHTRAQGGLRWNKIAFNERAIGFSEPTFIAVEDNLDVKSVYRGVDYYTDGIPNPERFTFKDPNTGEAITLDQYVARFGVSSLPEEEDKEPQTVLKPNNLREI